MTIWHCRQCLCVCARARVCEVSVFIRQLLTQPKSITTNGSLMSGSQVLNVLVNGSIS